MFLPVLALSYQAVRYAMLAISDRALQITTWNTGVTLPCALLCCML